MPLQNRVTPFGDIVALPQRGMFTGNRGILHDPKTKTLRRRWASRAWIVCACAYQDVRRVVWAGRSWTELFFLDEATALAAGHRPCFRCRRGAAEQFRAAFARARGADTVSARQIDEILHRERRAGEDARAAVTDLAALPEGAMVTDGQTAFVVAASALFAWMPDGYRRAAPPSVLFLLTPPSTLGALSAGNRPVLHPSGSNLTFESWRPRVRCQMSNSKAPLETSCS